MALLFDLFYLVLLVVFSPRLVARAWRDGKYRDGWAEKLLGRVPRRSGSRPCVWFHAVSVGEVMLLKPLLERLTRLRPDWEVVISTTTRTGLAVARQTFPGRVTFYAPLDFSWAVRQAVGRVRPTVLVLVELEIWPNLIRTATRLGSRVAVLNARLSEHSHRGYRRARWVLCGTLRRIDLVAAQSREYAERFVDLGVEPGRVHVTGSIKYDGLESDRQNPRTIALRRELGLRPHDTVFVAGSTMDGEEAAALSAYQAARDRFSHLRLVVVPRHPERFSRVSTWIADQDESVVCRSQGAIPPASDHDRPPVIIIDTLGELSAVWGLADVAFVGGSLFPGRNGQNMMEPAAFGASVLFGPFTANFKAAVEGLLERGGARQVADQQELIMALIDDLANPAAAVARGELGRSFVLAQNGASERTLALLDQLVQPPSSPIESARSPHWRPDARVATRS